MKRIGVVACCLLGMGWLTPNVTPSALGQAPEVHKPVPVRVERSGSGYTLLRGGKPYVIKGGGGDGSLKLLAEAGGNSTRTWGADGLGPRLDEAHRLGLTVTVGIWLGHERHGFNYNDAAQVAAQYQRARQAILAYRNHPALLMWGIGNEMEGFGEGNNAAIWSAVNNIAAMAHQLDPNHPTMTVVAEIGGSRVKAIHQLCPDIDIVGINSYGGVESLPERYRKAGGTRPFVITEFGPPGAWETPKNVWGAPPELTSTAKAAAYRRAWSKGVEGSRGPALGGYAFTWGHKQEVTATWFGMLLPDGSRLAAVDAMTEAWTGRPPANRCPVIDSLALDGPDRVPPGATVEARLRTSDPEGDPLKVHWILQRERVGASVGGDAETAPPTYPGAIVAGRLDGASVKMPKGGGGYRLFAYIRDGHGGAAVANIPLFDEGPPEIPSAPRIAVPLVLYDDDGRTAPPYVPSGWMGNTGGLKLVEDCADRPHTGKTCIRCTYQPGDGWAGVVWQHPANAWGDNPGGRNLTGAHQLSFWARGEKGGETVSFGVGIIGDDKPFPDTAHARREGVRLGREWTRYTIDLDGHDLSRITSGFFFSVAGSGAPTVFYLDDLVFE